MQLFNVAGFDNMSYFPTSSWYGQPQGGCQGSIANGRQNTGAGAGKAVEFFNTGFNSYQLMFVQPAARAEWHVGFAFFPQRENDGSRPDSVFFRIELGPPAPVSNGANTNTQMSVAIDPLGFLKIYNAGQGADFFGPVPRGTLLYTSPTAYPAREWFYFEIDVKLGVGGSIAIFIDDVELVTLPNVLVGQGTYLADRFTLRLQNFGAGYIFDDLYCASERLGPVRISPVLFDTDVRNEWAAAHGGSNAAQIGDRFGRSDPYPDLDLTYVESSTLTARDLFQTSSKVACFGRVLGVALSIAGRTASSAPSIKGIVRQPGQAIADLAVGGLTFPAVYGNGGGLALPNIQQAVSTASVKTGGFWTDREIQDAAWGYEHLGGGTARITAAWLEKVTSLRNVPFTCGSSSYAITRQGS